MSNSAPKNLGEPTPGFASTEHAQEMGVILGLSLRPEWEEGVVTNLGMLEDAAAQVLSFDLPDDIEPAVVFLAR